MGAFAKNAGAACEARRTDRSLSFAGVNGGGTKGLRQLAASEIVRLALTLTLSRGEGIGSSVHLGGGVEDDRAQEHGGGSTAAPEEDARDTLFEVVVTEPGDGGPQRDGP